MIARTIVKVIQQPPKDTVTEVVAIIGLIAALASLAWQAGSYWLGGPRLKLELLWGYWDGGNLMSAQIDHPTDQMMAAQGMRTKLIGVRVTNRGRMAITVDQVMAQAESGVAFGSPGQAYNPQPKFRLEPHSSETWWVDLAGAVAAIRAYATVKKPELQGRSQKCWIRVTTGSGDRKTRRWAHIGP